jgi:hypothetical protein
MNIIRTAPVELCLDGSATREYFLESAVTRTFITHLAGIGRMEYYPRFPRPFFRIHRSGSFFLKGVEGDTVIQVSYLCPPGEPEEEILSRIRSFTG